MNGLPEPVLRTALCFLYSHHLPPSLSNQTAKECIDHFQNQPAIASLVDLCESFIKNSNVRSEILTLVNNIHTSLERIVSLFETNNETDMLNNAARLWQSVKLSLG